MRYGLPLRVLALALGLAVGPSISGCAGDDDRAPPELPPVPCGAMTCGSGEYCLEVCTCCGFPTDAATSSSTQTCRPIPASCAGGTLCGCTEVTSTFSHCDETSRTVSVPCA